VRLRTAYASFVEDVSLGGVIGHFPTRRPQGGFLLRGAEEPRFLDVNMVIQRVPEKLKRFFGAASVQGAKGFHVGIHFSEDAAGACGA